MKTFSTLEVAKSVGVSKNTILSWLRQGKLPEPKRITQGGVELRLWSTRDLERVRKFKGLNYRKGRGRKKAD